MDAGRNDKNARAPEIEDVIKICRALNENGAEYVLIGGIAVILHGFARGTRDIDFLVNSEPENIKKIKKALACLPDNAISLIEGNEVKKYSVVRIADEVVVDLLEKACGIDYDKAKKDIILFEVDGVDIHIANKELLIKTKNTVRPGDKMDVEFLKEALKKERSG